MIATWERCAFRLELRNVHNIKHVRLRRVIEEDISHITAILLSNYNFIFDHLLHSTAS